MSRLLSRSPPRGVQFWGDAVFHIYQEDFIRLGECTRRAAGSRGRGCLCPTTLIPACLPSPPPPLMGAASMLDYAAAHPHVKLHVMTPHSGPPHKILLGAPPLPKEGGREKGGTRHTYPPSQR